MYTNADQLINKRDDLACLISDDLPDIIFVTECIPKAQVLPIDLVLLDLPEYHLMINFDASLQCLGSKGTRGICVYVKNGIHAAEVSPVKPSLIEHLWISIKLTGSDQLLAGCVYRSPTADPRQSIEELAVLLPTVTAINSSHLLICGYLILVIDL